MAKKKFGLSSTLNKNKSEESSILPKKIPLTRKSKNLEVVKEKVEAIHEAPLGMVKEPIIEIAAEMKDEHISEVVKKVREVTKAEIIEVSERKPKTTRKSKTSATSKAERMVRITVDTPKSMHVKLKIKAIENDITIRDYVIGLIKADLGLK